MSESTPSQAEGDRDPTGEEGETPERTTPSQAEGDDEQAGDDTDDANG
ncbi:hypothetical protein [Streptomyces sp. NPDC018059]